MRDPAPPTKTTHVVQPIHLFGENFFDVSMTFSKTICCLVPKSFYKIDIVTFLFVFDKYYPIID